MSDVRPRAEPNPEDPGAGASEARASESAARSLLNHGRRESIVRDMKRDVCAACYGPIVYAVRVLIDGWQEKPVEACWIDPESRVGGCPKGGMHQPAKVPPLADQQEVLKWLET